jgi:hypothetical protein
MRIYRIALAAPLIAAALAHAHAEVSRFDVLAREQPALQGHVFGGSGTVEKITARAAMRSTQPTHITPSSLISTEHRVMRMARWRLLRM